jgi:hypothetical protein
MDDTTIRPALTREEWATALLRRENTKGSGSLPDPSLPRIAALALHGQPFGFTHDDVRALREAKELLWERLRSFTGYADEGSRIRNRLEACGRVADRIEALLPPK